MITLHYLENSRAVRTVWALEELGIDYRVAYYRRQADLSVPDELKAVHPLGKSPVLTDGEKTIAESAVILDYLQRVYDSQQQFKPSNAMQLLHYQYWMHYAESALMPLLLVQLVLDQTGKTVPFLIRPIARLVGRGIRLQFITPRLQQHISYLEQYLANHEYFAGDFSFADIQMSYPLKILSNRAAIAHPNIHAFLRRIKQRPACDKARQAIAGLE